MSEVVGGLFAAGLVYAALRVVLYMRRSRKLRDEYRLAHHDQKLQLEAAWQHDPELAAHQRPLSKRELLGAALAVVALLAFLITVAVVRAA